MKKWLIGVDTRLTNVPLRVDFNYVAVYSSTQF